MWRKLLIALCCCLALASLSAQESLAGSSSGSTTTTLQPSELSSLPTSLLWQIGMDSLSSSIASFESLGGWLNRIDSSANNLFLHSESIWELSVKLEATTSEVSQTSSSLKRSSESLEAITTRIIKIQDRQEVELWIWRAATAISAAAAVFFAVRSTLP